MTPRQKQSSNLIMQFLCILFLFLVIYMIINMFSNRTMRCGCAMGCSGRNISCPCYRNSVMRQSPYSNEYYQPQIGGDFTSYLDQVRQNQLKFSREGFKEGASNMSSKTMSEKDRLYMETILSQYSPKPNISSTVNVSQKNIPNQLNTIRSSGGIASLMKKN